MKEQKIVKLWKTTKKIKIYDVQMQKYCIQKKIIKSNKKKKIVWTGLISNVFLLWILLKLAAIFILFDINSVVNFPLKKKTTVYQCFLSKWECAENRKKNELKQKGKKTKYQRKNKYIYKFYIILLKQFTLKWATKTALRIICRMITKSKEINITERDI